MILVTGGAGYIGSHCVMALIFHKLKYLFYQMRYFLFLIIFQLVILKQFKLYKNAEMLNFNKAI